MHLSLVDCERFFKLIDIVVSYAVDIEGFTQNKEKQSLDLSGTPAEPEDELDKDVFAYVSHDPDFMKRLFARAARDLPGVLDARDRRILRSWQEGAWETTAILADFTENGNALLSTPMGIVELSGISRDIADMEFFPPCTVQLVLLPFGERIVYATSIIQYPIALGDGFYDMLDREFAEIEAGKAKPISSASAYLKRVKAQKEKEREEGFAKLERTLDREARKAEGKELMPHGVHRGALAGLGDDEREQAIHEDFARHTADMLRDIEKLEREEIADGAIQGVPRKDLRAALECLERDQKTGEVYDLFPLADLLVSIDSWDGKKDGRRATRRLGARAAERPDVLKALLVLCNSSVFSLVERVRDAGGELAISARDGEAVRAIRVLPPLTFLYYEPEAGAFTVAIHEPVRGLLEELDWDAIRNGREFAGEAVRYAERACELYGIVTLDAFAEEFGKATGWKGEPRYLYDLLFCVCLFRDRDLCFEVVDGEPTLVAFQISEEWLLEVGASAEVRVDAMDYKRELLERQKIVLRRPLAEVMDETSLFYWLLKRESARLLREWLDAHVPDGENDFAFAERVMEELYDSACMHTPPTEQVHIVLDRYREVDFSGEDEMMDFFEELLAVYTRFVNDIPLWYDHGYSAFELHERETGHTQFFNEDGTVMKVGRNDPCPCGSGKKYKHCHGRR